MDYKVRKTDFLIEVKRPNYQLSIYQPQQADTIGRFGSDLAPTGGRTRPIEALISYSFKESLKVLDCGFNLTFVPVMDEDGLTWFDKIHISDIVSIWETGKKRFVGRVTDRRYSSRMTEEGATRTISISGLSLGNLLSSFSLILDTFLYTADTFAGVEADQLMAALSQMMSAGARVSLILEKVYHCFFQLALKTGNMNRAGIGVKALIDYYIDFGAELASDIVVQYPIALSLYKTGENNVWSILMNIIDPPLNELFPRFDPDTGKYHIVFRRSPFEPEDWVKLYRNRIPISVMTSFDFGNSDGEIFTYYLVVVAGSPMTSHMAMVLDADKEYGKLAERDSEKWPIYGYKPMIIEMKYFDKDKYGAFEWDVQVRRISEMLKRWYEHNDEFLSGNIESMTIDASWWKGVRDPRVGEKLAFLEGEFYIEAIDHSWSYGDSMVTKLSVSRGYVYSLRTGSLEHAIPNPGRAANALVKKKIGIQDVAALNRVMGM